MSVSASVQAPVERPPARSKARRIVSALLSLVIVVGIFWFFLPQFANIGSVWSSIKAMSGLELGLLVLAAVWNLATYGFVMVATMPGLTYPQAMVVTESSTAVSNTMPAGGALGIGLNFAMYTSWGFSRSRATVSLLLSGIWNNFAKLGLPVLALALVALQGSPSGGRLVAGLAGIAGLVGAVAVFALMLRSEAGARRVGEAAGAVASAVLRLVHRPPARGWEIATVKFRSRTIRLLAARWHWLTLATVVSHLSLYLVLLLALRACGVSGSQVGWAEVLAIFSFARLVTAIPLTPGGLGIVELALITGLSAAGGGRAQVAAGVLVFRALTYVLPIPLGLATYLYWRRNTSWRRAPGTAPRTPLVPETSLTETSPTETSPTEPSPTEPSPAETRPAETRPAAVEPAGTAPSLARPVEPAPAETTGSARAERARLAAWCLGGALVLLASAVLAHRPGVSSWERGLFRVVNGHTLVPFVVVWPVMQLGNFLTVPIAAVVAAGLRRFRLAVGIAVGGAAAYVLAKVVKHYVERGRPADLLPDVHIRGAAAQGLGYVSGHAAVVSMLALLVTPYLRPGLRRLVIGLAVLVCLARVYVGAHLPLDIVGGAALGITVGAAVRLVLGSPKR